MIAVHCPCVPQQQVLAYFTKWAEGIPLCDQTPLSITTALDNLFGIVHSDHQNLESTLLNLVHSATKQQAL